ncbi:hypothetical protein WKW77_11855 [Variovorax ureilyticus]|uniref:Uncharacterized protein n=1 Tax=Variovorax ureilyticus TaxID=1836198 RepID=A0ABU8VDM5_9BURK
MKLDIGGRAITTCFEFRSEMREPIDMHAPTRMPMAARSVVIAWFSMSISKSLEGWTHLKSRIGSSASARVAMGQHK